jgi:hypothetical protein
VAYSPDGRHVVSGSYDNTVRIWDVNPNRALGTTPLPAGVDPSTVSIAGMPIDLQPDDKGWVRTKNGGLLFWLPQDCRNGYTSPAIVTIPTNGHNRVVRVDLSDFYFGTSWTKIMKLRPSTSI